MQSPYSEVVHPGNLKLALEVRCSRLLLLPWNNLKLDGCPGCKQLKAQSYLLTCESIIGW